MANNRSDNFIFESTRLLAEFTNTFLAREKRKKLKLKAKQQRRNRKLKMKQQRRRRRLLQSQQQQHYNNHTIKSVPSKLSKAICQTKSTTKRILPTPTQEQSPMIIEVETVTPPQSPIKHEFKNKKKVTFASNVEQIK